MPTEMTNADRAARADDALEAYVATEDGDRDKYNIEESAQDLINDLLHLIRQECGEDEIEGILRRARANYDEELAEETATANQEG